MPSLQFLYPQRKPQTLRTPQLSLWPQPTHNAYNAYISPTVQCVHLGTYMYVHTLKEKYISSEKIRTLCCDIMGYAPHTIFLSSFFSSFFLIAALLRGFIIPILNAASFDLEIDWGRVCVCTGRRNVIQIMCHVTLKLISTVLYLYSPGLNLVSSHLYSSPKGVTLSSLCLPLLYYYTKYKACLHVFRLHTHAKGQSIKKVLIYWKRTYVQASKLAA